MLVLTTTELTSVGDPLRLVWQHLVAPTRAATPPVRAGAPQPKTSTVSIRLRNQRAPWVVAALTSSTLPPRGLHDAVLRPAMRSTLSVISAATTLAFAHSTSLRALSTRFFARSMKNSEDLIRLSTGCTWACFRACLRASWSARKVGSDSPTALMAASNFATRACPCPEAPLLGCASR